jgi:hypothetical protein
MEKKVRVVEVALLSGRSLGLVAVPGNLKMS